MRLEKRTFWHLLLGVTLLTGCTLSDSGSEPQESQTINVTCDTADLIAAINIANASPNSTDTINLDGSCEYILDGIENSDEGNSAFPGIISPIVINGNGATLFLDRSTNQSLRLIYIAASGDLTLNSLLTRNSPRLREEQVSLMRTNQDGGAILNNGSLYINDFYANYFYAESGGVIYNSGSLSIENSTFDNNIALNFGGGAIYNIGTADFQYTTFQNNRAFFQNNQTFEVGNGLFGSGGGISNYGGTLTLSNCNFLDNQAYNSDFSRGGAIFNWHGILTVESSVFTGNFTYRSGGAISSNNLAYINNSEFSDNRSVNYGGALSAYEGVMEVTYSNINNNSALRGAGIYAYIDSSLTFRSGQITGNIGEAIYAGTDSNVILENSTISNNTIRGNDTGAVDARGTILIAHTTIANNQGVSPGIQIVSGAVLTIVNSIVANNSSDCDFQGIILAIGENIDTDGSCTGFTLTDDPLLEPLVNNGGPTMTHALGLGSPAIGAAHSSCLSTDQRNAYRPSADCDLGAYEDSPVIVTQILELEFEGIVEIEIGRDTLCLGGPGDGYLVVQTLREGVETELVALSHNSDWFVVNSIIFEGAVCWIPREAIRTPIPPYDHLLVLTAPPLPVFIPTATPDDPSQPQGCWVTGITDDPICMSPCIDWEPYPNPCTP